MKKFNFHILVFAAAALLIVAGWCSRTFLGSLKGAAVGFIGHRQVQTLIADIDEASKNISFQGALVDLHSLWYRLTDQRVVDKADSDVVRLVNDYLTFEPYGTSEESMDEAADMVEELKTFTEEADIPLLYVMVPLKSNFGFYPEGTPYDTYYHTNHDKYLQALQDRGVHVLDISRKMEEQGKHMEDSYFVTDHHWLPETGLWAAGEICKELQQEYKFSYDPAVLELSNYNVEVHEDIFLGSEGKKVGRYFTPLGLDDLSVITPSFETDLTVEDPRGLRSGVFEDTVLNLANLGKGRPYAENQYVVYTGGDYALQTIENNLADPDGKKVLMIRDSFGSTVTPFLSLTVKSMHIMDYRHWQGTEEAPTLLDYIEQEEFDYVLLLFSDQPRRLPCMG